MTGETDFVLHLAIADMEVYERFCREVFHGDPNVRSCRTIVTMREIVRQGY